MKIGFTGDVFFGKKEKFKGNPLKILENELEDTNIVLNLESVLLPKDNDLEPIKDKICLRSNERCTEYLKELDPILVNLSNNHINDFGTDGVIETQKALESSKIDYFGVGHKEKDHNIFTLDKPKITFLSYSTRDSDTTGNSLFNQEDFMGPKKLSIDLFNQQIEKNDLGDHKKIVLLHWGHEDRNYPEPYRREIARDLIDNGADLIISNHPHSIQGFEKYKGKYIFYSLGNLLFPDSEIKVSGELKKVSQRERGNTKSLLPVFEINEKEINFLRLYKFEFCKTQESSWKIKSSKDRNIKKLNKFLFKNQLFYKIFFKMYIYMRFAKRSLLYFTNKIKHISKK